MALAPAAAVGSGASFAGILGGIGSIGLAGGSILGALQNNQKVPTDTTHQPFLGLQSTPNYFFGGGQLRRTNQGDTLAQETALRSRLSALQASVAPGFGASRLAISHLFEAQRQQAVGDLRTNLSRRGLLGASFAQDQVSQLESDFAMKEAAAMAEQYQQEFTATYQTLQAENQLNQQEVTRQLTELGLSTEFLKYANQTYQYQTNQLASLSAQQVLDQAGVSGSWPGITGAKIPLPPGTSTVSSTTQPTSTTTTQPFNFFRNK